MNSNSFIRDTALAIAKAHTTKEIEDSIFVFPNRRAGLFFQRELSLALRNTPFFVPDIYDINHFAESLSTYRKAEEIELLLYLHKAYRETYNDECKASLPLRSFIELGMKLLHDFDEIDKYLVDAHALFLNVYQLSELTASIELTAEQQEAISRFCNIVNHGTNPEDESLDFHRKYASLWNHITPIYDRFNALLDENKAAYEGKIYREVCEQLPDDKLPQKPIYFIGFNILTTSEEALIHRFEQLGNATLIFDYNHLQRTTARFDYHHPIDDFRFKIPPEIHDYPSMTSGEQAENLQEVLNSLIQASSAKTVEQNTAIVLADESMLVPALHSIPEEIEHLNITMGYPLSDTPIATFVAALIQYQCNIQTDRTGTQTIYHRHLMELLLHPYSHLICPKDELNRLIKKIRENNILHIPLSDLIICNDTLFTYSENIFAPISSLFGILDEYFMTQGSKSLDLEFIRQYRDRLTQLKTILERTKTTVDRPELTILIRRITRNLKVQFKGEPLKGLQIMGLLECRLLDFDNIIFVGFNDQFVPGNDINDNTLIPYSLRKPYGLPSHEITNLIYSYNFYRMLHRCKTLHLIYNLATGDNSKNEVSRFHHQLRYLYGTDITSHIREQKLNARASSSVYFPEIAPLTEFSLSASSLKHFITCPLRFYYRHLLKIKEPDQIDETMQDGTFGSLLHRIMELHYNDTKNTKLDDICLQAYRDICHHSYDAHGYDIIAFESAKTMARNIIRYDETQRAPFTVAANEHKFNSTYKGLTLYGIIDRIDNDKSETGSTWVIDYKTSGSNEEYDIMRMFDSAESKTIDLETMQILFYCYALKDKHKHLKAQLYKVYSIAKDNTLKPAIDYSEIASEFEPLLEQTLDRLIESLHNPSMFRQHAANPDNCKYCPFGNLCATKKVTEK